MYPIPRSVVRLPLKVKGTDWNPAGAGFSSITGTSISSTWEKRSSIFEFKISSSDWQKAIKDRKNKKTDIQIRFIFI